MFWDAFVLSVEARIGQKTQLVDIYILYVYCVTALPQGTIGNESIGRVSNMGLDHPLVIHPCGRF